VEDVGKYRRLGTTIDDALGEAFDRLQSFWASYPGSPNVERARAQRRPEALRLPRPNEGPRRTGLFIFRPETALRIAAEADAHSRKKKTSPTFAHRSRLPPPTW